MQRGIFFLQVDVQSLCFRNLHLVPVFEKREREADYYPVERCARFCVPAISQFQFRQPLRFVDRYLFPGNEAFVAERHEGTVGREHFRFQDLVIGGKRSEGIPAFFKDHRDIAVQRIQFLHFVAERRFVE